VVQAGQRYPLVVFMPDASANGPDPLLGLSQGIGATVWADPSWQKEHPCFVLAVQVPKGIKLTNDEFEAAPEYDQVVELIEKTIAENPVDTDRIYMTGQSQGCMSTFEMFCRKPDLLAAALCVSGQWDPERVGKAAADKKIFMGLSSLGPKEYPGMSAVIEQLAANGADVKRIDLNFRDGWDINNEKVKSECGDANIIFCVFDGDTIWPENDTREHGRMEHHNRGWEVTYQLRSALEWVFSQKKNG